jgi:hypothetical protein
LAYNAEEVRAIFGLIDWMMHLRQDLEERFRIELSSLEEKPKMPYVTSIERLALARGEARGEARGKTNLLLSLLAEICGPLSEQYQERIGGLTPDQTEQLAKSLLQFQSLADLEAWLVAHVPGANDAS